MEAWLFLLIVLSVALSAFAQIALKQGMSSPIVQSSLAHSTSWLQTALSIGQSAYVVLGLALYVLGAMLWLLVLGKLDVSKAYPFVGLGFVFTMLLGYLLLGEQVTGVRFTGTLLIMAGVYLVSKS